MTTPQPPAAPPREAAGAAWATTVLLPKEPCVVLSDGDAVSVVSLRDQSALKEWCRYVGPLTRAVTVAWLREMASMIETNGGSA